MLLGEEKTPYTRQREASEETESVDTASRIWGLQKGLSVVLTFYSIIFAMAVLKSFHSRSTLITL